MPLAEGRLNGVRGATSSSSPWLSDPSSSTPARPEETRAARASWGSGELKGGGREVTALSVLLGGEKLRPLEGGGRGGKKGERRGVGRGELQG